MPKARSTVTYPYLSLGHDEGDGVEEISEKERKVPKLK
jgi:hypothetical protein